METFRVDVTVSNLADRQRSLTLPALVDIGVTYATLPREVADALGLEPFETRRVRLANGRAESWPIGAILIRINGREGPALTWIGPEGGPALLGAVTLEELALGVDPSGRCLIPTTSYLVSPIDVIEGGSL
jgi:predicted aspartyl protease